MSTPAVIDPAEARLAVRASAARLALLLRSVQRPKAPALGSWDTTDLAMHLCHVLEGLTRLARGEGPFIDDLFELAALTVTLVADEHERDLATVADRIEAGAATFVQVVADLADGPPRPWLVRGVDLPPETLVGHVLNEVVVHSWDIARAQGVAWPIPGRHAALVLDTFLFPIIGRLGRAVVDQDTAAGVRASFDVRLRGGGGAVLRFHDGELSVDGIGDGSARAARSGPGVDCHLSVDPAAFLLVAWGRRSQWPAIARGQFLAWGRRPWLGPRLRCLLRNP